MSLFSFKFPEPYDAQVRAAALRSQSKPDATLRDVGSSAPPRPPAQNAVRSDTLSTARSRKQFSIFLAGAAFVGLSTLITKRSLNRKLAAVRPSGLFSPSNKVPEANGGIDAAEALTLATLNVGSYAVMIGGGALWALDISDVEDMRSYVRKGMNTDGHGKTEAESEDDIEEWMAVVMAKMSGKSDQELAEMVREAAARGKTEVGKAMDG